VLPLIIVNKEKNMMRLSALDRQATALGLSIGQPLANARAMLPALDVVEADAPADLKLLTQIADWCGRFTPLVALDSARGLLLDVTGATHLFGGEQAMLTQICTKLRIQGFAMRGAMAGTAVAARALARYRDGSVTAPGEEETAVAPLPIAALNLDPATTHALRRAGLKTIGQVATRKRTELVARLGAATLAILDEALGTRTKPLTPRKPTPEYWKQQNFAEPIMSEDVISTVLADLTTALGKILEQHGQGARRLEAEFFRTDGQVRCLAIEMGTPTRNPHMIERLFREKLATLADPLDPGFGFDVMRLSATRTEALTAGDIAFESAARDDAEISFLVDRLATRFGGHRVLFFRSHNTHIPEAAWAAVPAQHAKISTAPWRKMRKALDAPRRPLRVFARPEPVDFATAQHFIWRKVKRIVKHCEGPERIAMEWWRHDNPQTPRDYFRVEDSEGKRYWLYCKGTPPQWFMHGIFT
jgi:protein ImuB